MKPIKTSFETDMVTLEQRPPLEFGIVPANMFYFECEMNLTKEQQSIFMQLLSSRKRIKITVEEA